ncbi:recombinase family protein, partial [Salmonella enterica subsp. enterica serovar Typhi]|nr:recombinase family protein [Salmonella enterica subsp. enterica serovar Typhi]NRL01123.1 recombinase family protein [Salmonella enterica subsp. enterica serovar Typhi]NRL05366.1 recombinase family protein [Salmonella enterica subsp. enterica serovar Typhi]
MQSLPPNQRFRLNSHLYQLCIFNKTKRIFFMQIGYIRVSTNDQNTDLQRNA